MQLFDFVKDISSEKKYVYTAEVESAYPTFMVNRAFSYYPDTIFIAAEAAIRPMLSHEMHFAYMFAAVPKKNRFTKWPKADRDPILPCLQELYGYSLQRAEEAAPLLSEADRADIMKKSNKGGKEEKRRK
jgi:hypothetical protein